MADTMQGQEPEQISMGAEAFLESFGFKSFEEANAAMNKNKADIGDLKGKAKTAAQLQQEVENLRKFKEQQEAASLSELEKAQKRSAEWEKQYNDLQAQVKNQSRLLQIERGLAAATKDMPEAVASIYVNQIRLSAEAGKLAFDTDEELHEILAQQKEPFVQLSAGGDGKRPVPVGGERSGKPGQPFTVREQQDSSPGFLDMVKEVFTNKKG